jgi:16S rRNA processing protein RimM
VSADLLIGRVGPARGLLGEVHVQPFTDAPEERFAPGTVIRSRDGRQLTVLASSFVGARLVVQFAGVADRTAAEALRGTELVIAADDRPALSDPEEFYTSELIGLAASTPAGVSLGAVQDVIDIAGTDYLVLTVAGAERLVPFVAAIVPRVDIAAGTVMIDPPPGLFEL